jgi:integrase
MIKSEITRTSTASIGKRNKLKLNLNKEGTVRNTNGKVYVDFMYLGFRVREYAGLEWSDHNAAIVREQLDRIILKIKDGSFRFKEVFVNSKKAIFFTDLERKLLNRGQQPDEVQIGPYCDEWYKRLKDTNRVRERTLHGYRSHLTVYIKPFFGKLYFSSVSSPILDDFAIWAKQLELRGKPISNKTINKCLIPFKMICRQAAIKYRWGVDFNPFFGYSNLPENASNYQIRPFSLDEQQNILQELPEHWKPYFRVAFGLGLRQGEQLALKSSDIDFSKGLLTICKAMTLNENGKKIEGATKNKYSQRIVPILPAIAPLLETQKAICEKLDSNYLFCTETGCCINHANLSNRVWKPALIRAGIPYRPMIQTRHSFATTALSLGENPLWIADVMGHSDTQMVLRIYAKFVKNAVNSNDGNALNDIQAKFVSNSR